MATTGKEVTQIGIDQTLMPHESPQPNEPLPFDLDELMAWAMEEEDDPEDEEKYRAQIINIFADALRVDGPYGSDRETVCSRAAKAIADLQLVASHIPEESRSDPEAISLAKEESDTFLWELWTTLLDVASRVPHNLGHPGQETLMGILEILDGRPRSGRNGGDKDDEDEEEDNEDDDEDDDDEKDDDEEDGDEEDDEEDEDEEDEDEEDEDDDEDKPFWKGLPMFGVLSEFTAGPHFLDEEEAKQIKGDKDANVEKTIARWQNKTTFFARCYAAELGNAVSDDCAVYSLCEALEGGDPSVKWKDGTLWVDGTVLTVNDRSRLMAATAWIIHSGDELYRHSRHNSSHSSEGCDRLLEYKPHPAGRYFLAKHPEARHGMSLMRWNYWKDRLKSLLSPAPLRSRDMAVAEDVLAAVTAAVNKMEQIEQDERDEKERRAAMLIKLMEDLGLKKSGRAMYENWSAARIEKEKKKRELRKAISDRTSARSTGPIALVDKRNVPITDLDPNAIVASDTNENTTAIHQVNMSNKDDQDENAPAGASDTESPQV